MNYINCSGDLKRLSPTEEWRSVVGYWVDQDGQVFNFPDVIASNGGQLTIDNPKHKALALLALNYAKQRREYVLNATALEVEQLNKAIAALK